MSMRDIILASGSSSRRSMLTAAGIAFTAVSPDVDEDAIKETLLKKGVEAAGVAETLADAKALSISAKRRDALVIGGDQVLVQGQTLYSKTETRDGARDVLRRLRGTDHSLISAVVLAHDGKIVWRATEAAALKMREFSEAFLEQYLDREIPGILGSVGCYRIEGYGAQLFEWIAGDSFCIRGMPLVPLLGALREHGGLPA